MGPKTGCEINTILFYEQNFYVFFKKL